MFIIKKEVSCNRYYWNDEFKRWEGLENNVSRLNNSRLDELMAHWLQKGNSGEYSFFKV